jgi:hypothetical protein
VIAGVIAGCDREAPRPSSREKPAIVAATTASSSGPPTLAAPPIRVPPPTREGGVIVRSPTETALYIADEDHEVVRRVEIPVDETKKPAVWKMPGRPAQVLALADCVLVSVRDPGLLLVFSPGERGREVGRIELPDDAWGLAVSKDEATAFVTSAWSHRVSAVDLRKKKVRWSIDVAREPRGVVATSDGKALYVTHLVGAELTKIEDLESATPKVGRVDLPPDPMRTRLHERASATLAYASVASPDGRRLYVPRHALGTTMSDGWNGTSTVDVLSTVDDTPVAPARKLPAVGTLSSDELKDHPRTDAAGPLANWWTSPVVQPRAIVYVKRNDSLLVVAEGNGLVAELDALSVSPAITPLSTHSVAGKVPNGRTDIRLPESCGAASGIALSEDERTAWVFCRSTYDLVILTLAPPEGQRVETGPSPWVRLAEDPSSDPNIALGRRLFYDATEPVVSGGLGCASCHPEGRDDGFVWRETQSASHRTILAASTTFMSQENPPGGFARQTPMLAGRVRAMGPYGWRAESATLVDRVRAGFGLHRWWTNDVDKKQLEMRSTPLVAFLREGLVPPPRRARELSVEEQNGKEIFLSERARCATCHAPATDYSDRSLLPFPLVARAGFDEEKDVAFRVPSLLYVGGTPPYYHDGSFATLEELVEKNFDRMGKTSHLSAEERAALVAFLRTL